MNELDPRIAKELEAMTIVINTLDTLTDDAQARVIRWLADRYGVTR